MEVYRLSREKFSHNLSGTGAALYGARWNSVGTELVYTAANRSLAMAEVAVHLTLATLPEDFVMLTISIPDDISIETILEKDLSDGWNNFPYLSNTQGIGDKFVTQGDYCILSTPSAVTQGDNNFLLNPVHPDFKRIKIIDSKKFPFDHRIFK
jgi:RES domain-containing protein